MGAFNSMSQSEKVANIQKGIDQARAAAEGIKASLGSSGAVGIGTSDAVRAEESDTKSAVSRFSINSITAPDPNDAIDEAMKFERENQKLLKDRYNALESRRGAQISGIKADYEDQRQQLGDTQKKEVGQSTVSLARMGGFLGESASALGALGNLQRTHNIEISSLEAKKQAAIQAANDAIDDKQFEIAKMQVESVRTLSKEINDRKNKFFDQALQMSAAARAEDASVRDQTRFKTEMAEKEIDRLVVSGIDPSVEDIQAIATALGASPNVINEVVKAKQRTEDLKRQKEQTDLEMDIIRTLMQVPKGTYVKIGGATYEGMENKAESAAETLKVVKAEFDADRKAGMPLSAALDMYGTDLGASYIESIYEAHSEAEIDEKLEKGAYDYALIKEGNSTKKIVYDKEAYKKALEEWGTGGKVLRNDEKIKFDGQTYTGPEGEKPSKSEFQITKDFEK